MSKFIPSSAKDPPPPTTNDGQLECLKEQATNEHPEGLEHATDEVKRLDENATEKAECSGANLSSLPLLPLLPKRIRVIGFYCTAGCSFWIT